MAPDPATWYVMIDEQETGPLTRVELGVELASGAITPESLVWKQGMINWVPGAKVPELEALFKNPPRSPRAAGVRPPPPPKKQEKGMGLGEFDTAHFKLADLAPEDGGQSRNLEFDTAHFKLAEAKLRAEDDGQNRQMEFDTSHFRLQDLKAEQGGRALVPKRIVPKGMEPPPEVPAPGSPGKAGPRTTLKQASTAAVKRSSPVAVRSMPPPPVAAEPPMAKATQRPAARPVAPPAAKPALRPAPRPPEKDSDFDPEATSVDFRTLGQLVRNQQNAQSLFEKEIVPDEAPIVGEPPPPRAPDPHVAELSKWAASEMESGAKEDARHPGAPKKKPLLPPPVPVAPPEKSYAPLAIGLAAALVIACSILWFLLSGD